MITLVTGSPGHGKTQRALWMLLNDLRFKGRVVLYANVRGLIVDDPRIANWIPLEDIKQWDTAPQGAIIFVDECHQSGFFPVRGVGKPPKHIEDLATHRHLGLDFLLVTQNGKNMDVFVRRLVELHVHCKRPAQLPYTNIYEFQGFTDRDDHIPTDSALRHERWKLDKDIWSLYESTVENTAKSKLPRIVWALPVLALLAFGSVYFMYSSFKSYSKKADDLAKSATVAPVAEKTVAKPLPASSTSEPPFSLSRLSPAQRVDYLMHESRDWSLERVPLNADYPESSPVYDDVRVIRTFPRVSGCAASKDTCRCVDQQGTPAKVSTTACYDFVINGRFDPYREESQKSLGDREGIKMNALSAPGAKPDGCSTFIVYGIGGVPSTETRCQPQGNAQIASLPVSAGLTGQTPGAGLAGSPALTSDSPSSAASTIERGGYVKR